jgi:geranylgeranyl pyrophosphate synthase
MWQEKQAGLLREEIERLLAPLSGTPDLRDILNEALDKAGLRSLGVTAGRRPWPLLPLIVCEGISGQFETAIPAAAALELFKSAAEVFDDIEDADSSASLSSKYGAAVATNAATTLLVLAEKAIAGLATKGVRDRRVVRVVDAANSYYTAACAGQHLDLSRKSDSALSEEAYLEIATMKSASHLEFACCAGAIVGGASERDIKLYSEFGRNVGIAAQIANDIQGVSTGVDILKRKVTLPVINALVLEEGSERLRSWFAGQETGDDAGAIKDLLFKLGAVYYAVVKAEFYRQRALDVLGKVMPCGEALARLKMFVE